MAPWFLPPEKHEKHVFIFNGLFFGCFRIRKPWKVFATAQRAMIFRKINLNHFYVEEHVVHCALYFNFYLLKSKTSGELHIIWKIIKSVIYQLRVGLTVALLITRFTKT